MEQNKTDNTRRLARNTLYLYFRSFFCLVLSLYSSRLILQALGVDDYGINNAVAGFASMFYLVSGSLSSAISRFLTYEHGTGNVAKQKQIFSMSLNMMIVFAIIILILSVTLGKWILNHEMTITPGRETAALWAFMCAILTVMTGLIVAPFNSAIIAHEKMGIYAIISVIEAILRLGLALFLAFGKYSADRLILYAVLWAACTLSLQAFAILYCRFSFEECRFRLFYDKALSKELFSYAGWDFVGNISGTLSGQGVNMLLNVFCGPAVNAARGLSNTVHNAIAMFVNNFTIALTPQITKTYASGDMPYVKYLTYRGSRFAFYIMFLISLPVLLEAQFVFTLWLGEVPEHTVMFNRLTLIASLMGLLFIIFRNVQNASGNIKKYNLVMSLITLSQFPLSWIFLKLGYPPETIYIIVIFTTVVSFFAAHFIVSRTLGYDYSELMREVIIPDIKVVVISSVIPLVVVNLLPYGVVRFLLTCTLCVLTTVPTVLYIGCSKSEREFIIDNVKKKLSSFSGR